MLESAVANAVMRLGITFRIGRPVRRGRRAHPAFAHAWDDDIDAYARYDIVEDGHGARCAASAAAVRADSSDMILDDATRTALDRVRAPVQLLRAEHGLFDDDPLIPADALHEFVAAPPSVGVDEVAGVNHYALIMGNSPGARRVAAAIEASSPTRHVRSGSATWPRVPARGPWACSTTQAETITLTCWPS
jgi:hypothetical protein